MKSWRKYLNEIHRNLIHSNMFLIMPDIFIRSYLWNKTHQRHLPLHHHQHHHHHHHHYCNYPNCSTGTDMPRSFLMKFKDDKWKTSRAKGEDNATMSTRGSVNSVAMERTCISEENPTHLECEARSKLSELKSESTPEVHSKGFDCNNNNNNNSMSNNSRQDLDQSSVKFKSHWGVKEVFAYANKNNLNNDVSSLGLCKNKYISTDNNFSNNSNNNNKIVFCSEACGTNTTTVNGLSKKRHNVCKSSSSSSSSPSHSSIKWSSPSSLSSSSSVRPPQPKTSKGQSDIRRKIWSPPKDLEPRTAGNVDQTRKIGDAQYGGLSKFDGIF